MPLDPLQERIIRTALALPHARTLALAGGCAVIAHGLVDRVTRDVDLFTERDADEAVELCAALRVALAEDGLRIECAARPPHENRFVAVEPSTRAETAVEVFSDGGRLRPRILLALGPVLHPDDLAADKTLALWGRAEPRDFLDVITLRGHYGGARLLEHTTAAVVGGVVQCLEEAAEHHIGGPVRIVEDGLDQMLRRVAADHSVVLGKQVPHELQYKRLDRLRRGASLRVRDS